jgi:tripartite-type tricarboxylate transporter receptor subunit TctC
MSNRVAVGGVAACLLLGAVTAAQAQTPAEFYKGRDLRLLVSHPPGGGYDTYARFYARHLGRLMPGNPSIVVQNMPGAAGVNMTNYLFSQAPRDGSVIGLGAGPLATATLLGLQGARYDARQLSWIGNINSEVALAIAWHDQAVKSVKDLQTTELVVAGSGATDISAMAPSALVRLLGMKFKVVVGYPGSAAQVLALERGEVGGIGGYYYSSLKTSRPHWLAEKKINILLQYGFERHAELPDVPTLPDLTESQEIRDVLALIFLPQQMGRPVFGPPGIPADRLAVLRDALARFVRDPEALADAKKTNTEVYKPMLANEVAGMVERFHQMSPEVIRKAAEAMLPADVVMKK